MSSSLQKKEYTSLIENFDRTSHYLSLLALHYHHRHHHQPQFPAFAYEAYGSGVNVDFTMGTSSSNTGSGVKWGATTGAMGQQDSSSSKQGNGYASNIPYAAAMVSGSAGYEGSTGNNGTWVTSSTSTAPQYYNYLFGM